MLDPAQFKQLAQCFKPEDRVLIVSHIRPDGDAVGACAAMHIYMKSRNVTSHVVNVTCGVTEFGYFLAKGLVRASVPGRKYDSVLVLDCSNLGRTGLANELPMLSPRIINIDHHLSNDGFGTFPLVDREARATCEIVLSFLTSTDVPLTRELAAPLLHGMLTDTSILSIPGLKGPYFRKIAQLLETGLDYDRFLTRITQSNTPMSLELLANQLAGLQKSSSGKVCWTRLDRDIVTMPGYNSHDVVHTRFFDIILAVRGIHLLFCSYYENDRETHVEFRSKAPYNVADIAQKLHGGGHRLASGCQLPLPLDKAEELVLKELNSRFPELF